MSKSRDVETLTAHMRKKQSWADIDETLAKQPKIRMPNRRALAMWSSFDLARFRGGEEDWDDWEDRKRDVQQRQAEVIQTARNGDSNTVDLGHVAAALDGHSRRMDMMAAHQRQMAETDRQQREGMHYENRRAMEELARAHKEAANRDRMAAEVSRVHIDRMAAERDMLNSAVAAAGVPQQNVTNVYNTEHRHHNTTENHHHNNTTENHIDQSTQRTHHSHHHDHTSHSVTNNTLNEQSIHNQMMAIMHNNRQEMGQHMQTIQAVGRNQQQMMEDLRAHLMQSQRPQEPLITMINPRIGRGGGGGGPPAAGAAAAVVSNKRRNVLSLTNSPHHPLPPEAVAAQSKSHLPMTLSTPAAAPIPIVAQAPEVIQGPPPPPTVHVGPVQVAVPRTRSHSPRLSAARAKHAKEKAERDKETEQLPKPRGRPKSRPPEPETPQAPAEKKREASVEVVPQHKPRGRSASKKPEQEPETPHPGTDIVIHDASKRGRTGSAKRNKSETPQLKKTRAKSAAKAVEDTPFPSARGRSASSHKNMDVDVIPVGVEQHRIGGRSVSLRRSDSTPVEARPRSRAASRAKTQPPAETPYVAPHVAPLAAAATELGQDVVPQVVISRERKMKVLKQLKKRDLGVGVSLNLKPTKERKRVVNFNMEPVKHVFSEFATKRGRGRPLGSKNKKKNVEIHSMSEPMAVH